MKALWKEHANYLNKVREAQRLLLLPQTVPQRDFGQFVLDCFEKDCHNLMERMRRVMLNHNVRNLVKKLLVRMPHKVTVRSKV